MRFFTLSALLLALSLEYTSAGEAEVLAQDPYDMKCGIPKVTDAKVTDCEALFADDSKWLDLNVSPDIYLGVATKLACHGECCVFHRWAYGSGKGGSGEIWRQEAQHLLACANRDLDVHLVNGKASFGIPDQNSLDRTRHALCVAGGSDDGDDCFAGMLELEKALNILS